VIETKKDVDKDMGGPQPVSGMSVSGAIVFDARGRIAQQGQPTFDANPDSTAFIAATGTMPPTQAMVNPSSYVYDALNRPILAMTPDSTIAGGEITTTQYTLEVGPDHVLRQVKAVQDPNVNSGISTLPGAPHVMYHDTRGNVVAVQEYNRLDRTHYVTLNTQYSYDPLDELLDVLDASGNSTAATYDSVGRMVTLDSPDMGLTQYNYDAFGNLGSKVTARLRAKNEAITYQYTANRLQQITYPESLPVIYTYGDSTETGLLGFNRAGRVKQEQSEAGIKSYQYDSLGNVSEEAWSLNRIDHSPGDNARTATMSYTYDSFARLQQLVMPGASNEVVAYGYDHGGNVTTAIGTNKNGGVTNYLLNIGYDEFEQRTSMVAGNGVKTTYTYDPLTRRLSTINASELDRDLIADKLPARTFQAFQYTYDPVGNITAIANNAPIDPDRDGSAITSGPVAQTFTYDDLYQLWTADGLHQNSTDHRFHYGLSFTYDAISNVVQKAQTSDIQNLDNSGAVVHVDHQQAQTYTSNYTYGLRPHAPTEVDDTVLDDPSEPIQRTLSYDESGNQTGWVYGRDGDNQTRKITWNEEDRIKQVNDGSTELNEVLYDGAGQRAVKKTSAGEESAYFGANFTLRDGEFRTKHIFAGDTRIASKLTSDDEDDNSSVLYFHEDHLGSTNFLTDETQKLVAHEEYFPTGELWVDEADDASHLRQPYLFTGKELDPETGLYYFGARYYDPHLSQWASPDPMLLSYILTPHGLLPSRLSLYTYSRNNPLVFLDPNGLQDKSIWQTLAKSTLKNVLLGPAATSISMVDFFKSFHDMQPLLEKCRAGQCDANDLKVLEGIRNDLLVSTAQNIAVAVTGTAVAGVEALGEPSPGAGAKTPVEPVAPPAAETSPPQAAAGVVPELAGVLEGHGVGQGFTGVFDTATGRVGLAPSTADPVIPQGWVPRAGGHADVSATLGGDPAGHAGFAVILEEGGGLRMTWRSGTLNQGPGSLVPQALRPTIVHAVEAATGRKVVSF
jgi:RHS repeat-associated protein